MKIELVLSKTYICGGKVYNKGYAYEVPDSVAQHLLSQVNERDVPYFRKSAEEEVYTPDSKSVNKGGKPKLVEPDEDAEESEESVELVEVKEKKKKPTEWQRLRAEGSELGVYKHGMNAAELRAAIEEAKAGGDDAEAVVV